MLDRAVLVHFDLLIGYMSCALGSSKMKKKINEEIILSDCCHLVHLQRGRFNDHQECNALDPLVKHVLNAHHFFKS